MSKQADSFKLAISKTDSRLILAILILMSDVIPTMLFFYWSIPFMVAGMFSPGSSSIASTLQTIGGVIFSGLTPIVALAWQWYFQSRSKTSG